MKKIIIIGAGAAGIIAALKCSAKNEVILLDSNEKIGKKILLTGNGKCNYWNKEIKNKAYETENKENLSLLLTSENIQKTFSYLEKLGIYPDLKGNYYYPYNKEAASVRSLLERQIKKEPNITFVPNFKVTRIEKRKEVFYVASNNNNNQIKGDVLILATGGKSAPKTGSDGSVLETIENLGHSIIPFYPGLTPLYSTDCLCKSGDGIRVNACVKLIINKERVKEEIGELQITKKGLSGICIFNLSNLANKFQLKKQLIEVEIDFLPTIPNFDQFKKERSKILNNPPLEDFLETLLPYKLIFTLLKKAKLKKELKINNLSKQESEQLEQVLKKYRVLITEFGDFERSQASGGGIPLNEINPQTLESTKIKDLYFIGELLDVVGDCGGFNLAFAFLTGYKIGEHLC